MLFWLLLILVKYLYAAEVWWYLSIYSVIWWWITNMHYHLISVAIKYSCIFINFSFVFSLFHSFFLIDSCNLTAIYDVNHVKIMIFCDYYTKITIFRLRLQSFVDLLTLLLMFSPFWEWKLNFVLDDDYLPTVSNVQIMFICSWTFRF